MRAQGILSCRIQIALPEGGWIHQFTTTHPQVKLEVMDRLVLERGLALLEIRLDNAIGEGWSGEIRALPGVKEVESLGVAGGWEACRVYSHGTAFIPLFKRLKLVRHFPFPIQSGVATWNVVGPEAKVRALLKVLQELSPGYRVVGVRHGLVSDKGPLLTPRQQEVLRRAMAEGYFDVPRRISLSELAPKMGIAISTLSVTLAVIEKKILEPHL